MHLLSCGGSSGKSAAATSSPASTLLPLYKRSLEIFISPSKVMVGGPSISYIEVFVKNYSEFPPDSIVQVDGVAIETYWGRDKLMARPHQLFDRNRPGILKINVVSSEATSNAVPFEFYHPLQGPQPFDAGIMDHHYAMGETPPHHIEVADFDGDSVKDLLVLVDAPYSSLTGYSPRSLFFLKGRGDGTLDNAQTLRSPLYQ